ncbi:MAG: response regulator [Anaerolineae bacterium]|nr:response regulator [Anaerolineae bacterium]
MARAQILVVEDDSIIVMELEDRLYSLGYVVCATTAYGEEAIEKAAELGPDLVLMDIRLKGAMDGITAAAEIRERYDIPVVYLTAYADSSTLQRAQITEPYSYIIKPFEERELHIAIDMALYRHRMERERSRLENQLFQAQRLETAQALVAGIVHEFNNLMTTIIAHSSFLLPSLGEEDPLRHRIEFIKQAGERAAILTQQVLAFSVPEGPEPKPLDVNTLIGDMRDMIQGAVGESIALIDLLEPGPRYVKGDRGQIEQVIMNLVINAQQAMPEGGELTIKTETITLNKDQSRHLPGAYPGTFICLSVTDTGVGMDQETIRRVFEPFFSTKQKGTGLGLPITNSIVRQHNGWIEISSTPWQGSTFRICLPAFLGDVESEPQESTLPAEWQGMGQRILVVEDNDGVRAAVSEMLQSGGYVVFEAANAREALDLFDKEEGEFHLIFSDVVLPDEDGVRLVDQLLARKPGVSVLMSSGYMDERAQWPLIRARGFHFLQKPFGYDELMPVVREILYQRQKQ